MMKAGAFICLSLATSPSATACVEYAPVWRNHSDPLGLDAADGAWVGAVCAAGGRADGGGVATGDGAGVGAGGSVSATGGGASVGGLLSLSAAAPVPLPGAGVAPSNMSW